MTGIGDFFGLYSLGFPLVFQPQVLLTLLVSTAIGVVFGVIPGLSATIGVAIFTPLTFAMSPHTAFAVLLGIYCGSIYGGSISAILINIPGTPAAVMTRLDGYPMAQRGEAGRAIGLATTSSFIGGILSVFLLAFFAPIIANFALRLSAQEYFAVCLFGVLVIAYISSKSILKGIMSGLVGLLLATVGMDPIHGTVRFTFGKPALIGGIEMIPVMVGIFGISQVLKMAEEKESKDNIKDVKVKKLDKVVPSFKELFKSLPTLIRGSIIGVFIGAVPATGGTIASIISYGVEKAVSKTPEKFGTGEPKGIIGPESANNAATGGAMIPMMTLGIPGDVVTAILIGALMLQGLRPGPMLFQNSPEVVSSIFLIMFLANFVFLAYGLFGAKYFAKVVSLPRPVLVSMITCLTIVGTYSVRNSVFDVWVLLIAGIVGFIFDKVDIPAAPLVLGFILGRLLEEYLRRGLLLSSGNIFSFFTRPISGFFLIAIFVIFVGPPLFKIIKKTAFALNKNKKA